MAKLSNITKYAQNPTAWFKDKGTEKIKPSSAEIKIAKELKFHGVQYHTEVSFAGMQYSTGWYARFDFWIPSLNMIIEYDGESFHKGDQIHRDSLKTSFCIKNKIKLIRLNKIHYYRIPYEICKLLNRTKADTGPIVESPAPLDKEFPKINVNKPKKKKKKKNKRKSFIRQDDALNEVVKIPKSRDEIIKKIDAHKCAMANYATHPNIVYLSNKHGNKKKTVKLNSEPNLERSVANQAK